MNNLKKWYSKDSIFDILFIGILSLCFLIWMAHVFYRGMHSSQLSLFFARLGDFFADATNVIGYSSEIDPYNNTMYTGLGEKAYPPLVYAIMYFFSRLISMQPYYEADYFLNMIQEPLLLMMIILVLLVILLVGYELMRYSKKGSQFVKAGTAMMLIFSGPMMFTIERGNVLICVPFLCLAFILFYNHENPIVQEIGLIALALAAGIKMTPAILGCILLFERQWKKAARTVCYGVLVFVVPFLMFKGGLSNIPLFIRNMLYLLEKYQFADGCSIRNLIEIYLPFLSTNSTIVTAISFGFAALLLAYSYLTPSFADRILALSLIFIAVPNYSAFYCTLYLIPPVILFLNERNLSKSHWLEFISFMLVFIPIQFYMLPFFDYHLGIALLLLILAYRFVVVLLEKVRSLKTTKA